jgi:RNA polymerase sigma-70 factor (ECF subfamily)
MGGHNELHKELIDRCKVGDIKAQYSLYKLFSKSLYNVAMRFMNNKMDADEIVQDTFITAFKKIENFEGKGAFGQWLKRIAINNCISVLRKRKIHFDDIEAIQVAADPDEDLDEQIDPGIVHRAIRELPDKARTILNLYALEGYKHREIGEILGITESTSKTQYKRAKQILLDKLKNVIHEN